MEASGTSEERADGLRVLHANYGSTVAVATGAGPIVQVGAAVAGQFTGRFQASRLPDPAAKPVRALPGIRDEHSIHVASASLSAD